MKNKLIILFTLTVSANADFLESKILKYAASHCSNEFTYRIQEIQSDENYIHYIYELKDKKNQKRQELYNNASFSFKLKSSSLIEVSCPHKNQEILGRAHHWEID